MNYLVILTIVLFCGVLLACKIFKYNIPLWQKAAATLCYVVLVGYHVNLPYLPYVIPALGLYLCLMDKRFERTAHLKVFAVSFLFTFLAGFLFSPVNLFVSLLLDT